MKRPAARSIALPLVLLVSLTFAGCAATGGAGDSVEPMVIDAEPAASEDVAAAIQEAAQAAEVASKEEEGEVPLVVAESEPAAAEPPPEVVVQGTRSRHDTIRDLVAEAQKLLRDVELQYVFTGKGKRETLRGRPVAFALWSEKDEAWTIAHIEIPRPPVRWRPGRKPLAIRTITPGIQARHVKGTGAERLMVAFSRDGEPLKVYGRKFPVFDNTLLKRKKWRAVAETAKPIVYLPFTEDTFDPGFVDSGREFLVATARKAMEELRLARVPSAAFPGELLADAIPLEVVTTLAVIEQTDDKDYAEKQTLAFEEVLSQYGLKQEEAYRYSVSSANALGPMQFTNRRGNGTYSLVVRRCPGANLDPVFESGATNLLNAMKAAICLLDLELGQMRADIRRAYRDNPQVLGIFPVAAYNGGPRNVTKLYRVLTTRMKVKLEELSRPGVLLAEDRVKCPCVWRAKGDDVRPVSIPRYNNENRWYIEKYQSIVSLFESEPEEAAFVPPTQHPVGVSE
jgi:anti-sigma factor ChrR (cupin superfamily)